jgi:hypothetical protein
MRIKPILASVKVPLITYVPAGLFGLHLASSPAPNAGRPLAAQPLLLGQGNRSKANESPLTPCPPRRIPRPSGEVAQLVRAHDS